MEVLSKYLTGARVPGALVRRMTACLVLFTFFVTGVFENAAGIDFKKAFAYSLPAGSINAAGAIGDIKDSANPVQSFHTDLFTGRGQVSIPVFAPPGRRGLTPQVALNYSSSSGGGWAGIDWSLGYSVIQRSTKKGVPSYNDTQDIFNFMIQGVNSELIKIAALNEYRAKDESGEFLKFIFQSGYWIVYDKSGTEYTFGQNAQARQSNPRGIFGWCLEKVKDTYGNTMLYTYTTNQGEIYLSRIDYNGNETQNFAATHSIEFITEARPDAVSSYITGAKVVVARRLKEIQVKVQNQLARKYILTYEQSPHVGRSRLKTVQECGTDAAVCLPPTTFVYQNQTPGFQPGVEWPQVNSEMRYISSDNNLEIISTVDLDGDGLPDRVRKTSDTSWTVYRNTGNGFASEGISWGPIQGYQSSSWASIRADSNGTGSYANLLDVNGDGLLDRVVMGYSGNSGGTTGWAVQYNTGSGFANQVFFGPTAQTQYIRTGQWFHDEFPESPDNHRTIWETIDMNGDGYLDRLSATGWSSWTIYFGNSTGFSSSSASWNSVQGIPGSRPALRAYDADWGGGYSDLVDINGDGLPDHVVGGYSGNPGGTTGFAVQYSNGLSFENMQYYGPLPGTHSTVFQNSEGSRHNMPNTVWLLADVNQDGLPDRVHKVSNSEWNVYFNTGSGFNATPVSWGPIQGFNDSDRAIQRLSGANVMVDYSDINGDGFPDRIVAHPSEAKWLVQLAHPTVPDLLAEINNGRGGRTFIEYKPSTQFDNRDLQGVYRLPFPSQVVTRVTQTDGLGNSIVAGYSYKGGMFDAASREFRGFREVAVTDARGTQTITTFHQDGHRRGRAQTTEVRDQDGNLFSKTVNDWGNCQDDAFPGVHFVKLRQTDQYLYDGDSTFKHTRKRFEYDQANGNLITVFDDGDPEDPLDDRRQTTEYALNPSAYILNAVSKTSAFDSQNQLINEKYFYYDNASDINAPPTKGSLTKQEDLLEGGLRPATWITYDNFGNVQSVTDARSFTTTNEYDPALKLYLTKVTNTLGHTQEFTYDPLIAQITQTKDQNNQISRTIYDKLGRAVKTISPLDTESSPTRAVFYDDAVIPNRVVTHIKSDADAPALILNAEPQAGYLTIYTFTDGLGRTIQKRSPSEMPGTQIVSGVVKFDERGQTSDQFVPYFADFRTTYASPPSSLPHASFTYDAVGRRTRIDYPDSSFSTVEYDDYTKTVIDPNGNQKRYTQDAFGNLAQVEEFNQGEIYTTRYAYDPLNRLIRTINHLGHVTEVGYDMLGRKTSMHDPNMGFWSYTYDLNNNLLAQTDAKQQTIQFQYDALNRLTRKTYPNGTHINYVYDSCAPEACSLPPGANYSIGKLLQITDNSGIQTFRYDPLGRVIQDKKELDDAQSYTFTRIYDPQGRVASLEYPDGDIFNLTFNAMGEAESLTLIPQDSSPKTIIQNVDYNPSGQITKIEFGNGVVSDYTYNPQTLRLEHLATRHMPQGTSLQDFTYQFDNAGNVLSITDAVNTNTQSFLYDNLDRLTQAAGSYGTHAFEYNAIGNMTHKAGALLEYNDPLHPHAVTRHTSQGTSTDYEYDANGNMTRRGDQSIVYDYDNKPVRIEELVTVQQAVHFTEGWNTLELAFQPYRLSTGEPVENIEDILEGLEFGVDYDQISYADEEGWKHYVGASEFSDFTALEVGRSYQIYVTRPGGAPLLLHGDPEDSYITTKGEYIYDAAGQRAKKLSDTRIQYFLGKDYEVEYNLQSSLTRKAFFLGDTRIAELETTNSEPGAVPHLRFFHGDHLGSTNIVTNEQGNRTLLMEYLPYGEVKLRVGTDPVQNTFTGQKEDLESRLMYYNARYYDPKIGRFIQADSIVPNATDPQEFNRYSYVNNNPIKFTDPTGHKKKKWWKKALGIAILAVAIIAGLALGALAGLAFANYAGLAAGGALKAAIIGGAIGAVGGGAAGGLASSAISGGNLGAGALGGALTGFTAIVGGGSLSGAVGASASGVNSGLATGDVTKANEFVKVGAQMLGNFGVTDKVLASVGSVFRATLAPISNSVLQATSLEGFKNYFVDPSRFAWQTFANYAASPEGQAGLRMLADGAGLVASLTFASGNVELYHYAAIFSGVSHVARGLQIGFGPQPSSGTANFVMSTGMGKYAEVSTMPFLGPTYSRVAGIVASKATTEFRERYN